MKLRVSLLPIAALLLVSSVANALPLAPGASQAVTPYVPTGAVLVASQSTNVDSIGGGLGVDWSATLISQVYRRADLTLEFWYQVINTSNASIPERFGFIDDLSVNGYAGFAIVDASQQVGGNVAQSVTRQPAGGPFAGQTVSFNFAPINPGQSSAIVVLQTLTPNFKNNVGSIQDGVAVSGIPIYAPAAVPEPSAYGAVLALGLGGLFWIRQRRMA